MHEFLSLLLENCQALKAIFKFELSSKFKCKNCGIEMMTRDTNNSILSAPLSNQSKIAEVLHDYLSAPLFQLCICKFEKLLPTLGSQIRCQGIDIQKDKLKNLVPIDSDQRLNCDIINSYLKVPFTYSVIIS